MRRAALLLVLATSGCGVMDRLVADAVIENQEKIRSFEGVYTERGTIPGDPSALVRVRARFEAPSSFVAQVIEPEDYAGDTYAYVGSDLYYYSVQGNWGIHVRSVPWDVARWREAVRASVAIERRDFTYVEADGKETVAGRVATSWQVIPERSGPLLVGAHLWLDDEFTVPLRVQLGGDYESCFESIAFNRAQAPVVFEPREDAMWFEIDMKDPPLSLEEADRFTEFELLQPHGSDLERTRIVRAKQEGLPVVSLIYEKGPFWASVTESLDRGLLDPGLRGIEVDAGGVKGRLQVVGTASAIVFVKKGVTVSVFSNLPAPEALAFARTLDR